MGAESKDPEDFYRTILSQGVRPMLCPKRLATRIVAVVEALRDHPRLGRAGTEPGIRELIIGGTPYIVLYRVRGRRVIISTIWHGAQRKEL